MCLKVSLNRRFLTASRVAWQAALKKTKVEIELLNEIDVLLMVEKDVRSEVE